MTLKFFVSIAKLPLLALDALLMYFSPYRVIKRLLGKDASGNDEKTFWGNAFSEFFDTISWIILIIIVALFIKSFHA